MESILHQLKKYQLPRQATKVVVPETTAGTTTSMNALELAEAIIGKRLSDLSVFDIATQNLITDTAGYLKDLVSTALTGRLYPLTLLGIYHCYGKHSYIPVTEERTDQIIAEFMQVQDMDQYRKLFEDNLNSAVKLLIMLRAYIATYASGHKPEDKLPPRYRQSISKFLGIRGIAEVMNESDRMTKTSNPELLILGRLGYLVLWNWLNKKPEDKIPFLLTQEKRLGG